MIAARYEQLDKMVKDWVQRLPLRIWPFPLWHYWWYHIWSWVIKVCLTETLSSLFRGAKQHHPSWTVVWQLTGFHMPGKLLQIKFFSLLLWWIYHTSHSSFQGLHITCFCRKEWLYSGCRFYSCYRSKASISGLLSLFAMVNEGYRSVGPCCSFAFHNANNIQQRVIGSTPKRPVKPLGPYVQGKFHFEFTPASIHHSAYPCFYRIILLLIRQGSWDSSYKHRKENRQLYLQTFLAASKLILSAFYFIQFPVYI